MILRTTTRLCSGALTARTFATSRILLSHVGSAPVPYPSNLEVVPTPSALTLTGPRGTTSIPLPPFVQLSVTPAGTTSQPSTSSSPPPTPTSLLTVSVQDPTVKKQRATWGLTRALIANAVKGLTEGYTTSLKLVGVGYRASLEPDPASTTAGQRLRLKLDFAHDVLMPIPDYLTVEIPQPTRIVLRGNDKHLIGLYASKIRAWRKPEPYKGKVCVYLRTALSKVSTDSRASSGHLCRE
jgi:large subunit ribosomal protein L6